MENNEGLFDEEMDEDAPLFDEDVVFEEGEGLGNTLTAMGSTAFTSAENMYFQIDAPLFEDESAFEFPSVQIQAPTTAIPTTTGKFKPNVNVTRTKREETHANNLDYIRVAKEERRGKGRERGMDASAVASGPFAFGPSNSKSENSVNVGREKNTGFGGGYIPSMKKSDSTSSSAVDTNNNTNTKPEIEIKEEKESDDEGNEDFTETEPAYIPLSLGGSNIHVSQADFKREENKLYLLQFPQILPSSDSSPFTDSEGRVGKLIRYKSGALKLRIGKITYDVTHSPIGAYLQNVSCVNDESKKMYFLGGVEGKFVCVPDIQNLIHAEM